MASNVLAAVNSNTHKHTHTTVTSRSEEDAELVGLLVQSSGGYVLCV